MGRTWLAFAIICTCLLGSHRVQAAQPINLNNPIGFFTNAAARMLADAGFGTNIVQIVNGVPKVHIQIYPTNYYSPSVHRYLQFAANIYDASTNRAFNVADATNGFPSVFRPLFFDEIGGGNRVWITGYSEVTNVDTTIVGTNLATLRPFHDLYNDPRQPVKPTDMVYGVPLVVGAKKGFPNFNEYGLLQDISVSRNLIFHRLGAGSFNTNQVYTMGISNVFAIEAWNSYTTPYPRQLQIIAIADIVTAVTNEAGICRDRNNNALSNLYSVPVITNIPAATWLGYGNSQSRQSFVFPLGAMSYLFLTNSDFAFSQNRFLSSSQVTTDPANNFPVPPWKVKLTPRVRFALVDTAAQRIIDYVNLSSPEDPVDVAELLKGTDQGGEATCNTNFNGEIGSLFCTNRADGGLIPSVPTYGILNQYEISMGSILVSAAFWQAFNAQANDKAFSIDEFRTRILSSTDTTLDFAAPFSPRRVIHHSISWQANDPLVHYVIEDLQDPLSGKRKLSYDTDGRGSISGTDNPLIGFPLPGQSSTTPLNQHFRPWGGNPNRQGDTLPPTSKNLALKDSQVTGSDAWNFPTNGYPNLDWLGRVHRGTPWQTLFLKAINVDLMTWGLWTGVTNANEAQLTMPTNDWRVASLIVSMLNTNDPRHLFSVNQPNSDAWRVVLNGLTVLTNIGPSQFNTLVMSSNSPQAAIIGTALDGIREIQPDQYFHDVGDILATAELSTASPWLNTSNGVNSGITDEAYEKIPAQLLSLLRQDSVAVITGTDGALHVRFSGIDGYAYGVQVSTNLINWTNVITNYPTNGYFDFIDSPSQISSSRFCRSVLLP